MLDLNAKPPGTCRDSNCACDADPALGGYCGAYCDNADRSDFEDAGCGCGHDACLAAQPAPTRDEPVRIAIGNAGRTADLAGAAESWWRKPTALTRRAAGRPGGRRP